MINFYRDKAVVKQQFLQCCFIAMLAVFNTACAESRDIRWVEDINFYAAQLELKHIDLFHSIGRNDFEQEIQQLKTAVPTLSDNEIYVELMRLTRKIDDGHTSFPLWGLKSKQFPLTFTAFEDDLFVTETSQTYAHLVGAKLVSINHKSVADVRGLLSDVVPFSENGYSNRVRIAQYVTNATVLNGLGIIGDEARVPFVFAKDDKTLEETIAPEFDPALTVKISPYNHKIFSPIKSISDDLWFGANNKNKTVYIKFRRYTSMPKMESFAKDVLGFINKNQSQHLIIDLRDNYGGDFFVGLRLAQYLVLADSIDWKKGVYVLIDNVTFSAAMSNAAQYKQILNATLVGSPTGAKPSGYQDMGQFQLPNSKLEVTYSKRVYHFLHNEEESIEPDYYAKLSIVEYLNNNDSVISKAVLLSLKQIE